MIEIIGGVWAAGETKTFHVNGQYLEILDAQYPVDVLLMDKSGAQLSIMRNSEASFFSRPSEGFSTVQITSSQAQAVRVFVGSGDAGTRRISSTVQVVDGNKARSIAGGGFFWRCSSVTSVATNRPFSQLWNPPGSGVRVIVDGLTVACSNAGGFGWGLGNFALAAAAADLPVNALAGAAVAAKASTRVEESANPALTGATMGSMSAAANQSFDVVLRRPIVVMPGYGLNVGAAAVGVGVVLSGAVQFFEELI